MTVTAGPVGMWTGAEPKRTHTLERAVVGTLLMLALLPVGIYGFPIVVAFADIAVPLLGGYVLGRSHGSPLLGTFVGLVFASVVIILTWELFDPGAGVTAPLQSAAFFFKPWIAYFAAYRLVRSGPEPAASARRLMLWAASVQAAFLGYLLLEWSRHGQLTTEFPTGLGQEVRAFVSDLGGTFSLYGYGQVNSTAAILVAAPALFLFAFSTTKSAARVLWLGGIPVALYVMVASGSRGSVVGSSLFVILALLSRPANPKAALVTRLMIVFGIVGVLLYQGANLLALSPKYATTLEQLSEGQTAAVTSGRNEILAVMVQDIVRSPVVGTGFGDFQRFHTAGEIDWIDSSPHNAWVGPLHKSGVIIGGVYLAMLVRAAPKRRVRSLAGAQWLGPPLFLAVGLGVMPALDALTTPVTAATYLVIAGSIKAVEDAENTAHEPVQT